MKAFTVHDVFKIAQFTDTSFTITDVTVIVENARTKQKLI